MTAPHAQPRPRRRRARLERFVARYGWRAYALPVLTVLTVVAPLLPTASGRHPGPLPPQPAVAAQAPNLRVSNPPTRSQSIPPTHPHADATACRTNTAATFVLVSLHAQHVWMCQGHRQVYTTPATTGEFDNGDATPTGEWVVQARQTNRYLTGQDYRQYVHYWIPFDGDFGFHDASWQTMPFGAAGYRTHGSHGCVHLPMTAVSWLYGWSRPGSTVVRVIA